MGALLVPVDGSTLAEAALPWAACLAQDRHLSLVLVAIVRWPPSLRHGALSEPLAPRVFSDIRATVREDVVSYVEGLRVRLATPDLPVDALVREGDPQSIILDLAEELQADAIAMSSHGRGGVTRAVLGSVAEHVVQHATVPVLVVRPSHAKEAPAPSFHRLLVPLDGSALAEQAVPVATEIAGPVGTLVLVRVEETGHGIDWRAEHYLDQVACGLVERVGETSRTSAPVRRPTRSWPPRTSTTRTSSSWQRTVGQDPSAGGSAVSRRR